MQRFECGSNPGLVSTAAIKIGALIFMLVMVSCSFAAATTPTVVRPTAQVIIQTLAPLPTRTSTPTATPSDTPTPAPPTATSLPPATPTPLAQSIWVAPDVPGAFGSAVSDLVVAGQFRWGEVGDADVQLVTAPPDTPADQIVAHWFYAPIVAFPTIADDVSLDAIKAYWAGNLNALASLDETGGAPPTLVIAPGVLRWLTAWLGTPAANLPLQVVPDDGVAATLWKLRVAAWSIVPFADLDPSEKVLTLDGADVLSPGLLAYPLMQSLALSGSARTAVAAALARAPNFPHTNRDLAKLTVLVMTGTTALTRATAYQMEQTGITLPARDILPFLADASLVHTSNEVAFSADCPYPNPSYQVTGMTFCSRESYFDLLKAIHLNIVESTGNHVNDWGQAAFAHTLDLYDAAGITNFGGGRDLDHAKAAAIVHDHGNTIAFIGCNPVGPNYAWATDSSPGSAPCDDNFLSKEIPRLQTVANIVIMTIQYQEYYEYDAPDDQVTFFHKYAALGANVVFGSQAHHPQGFAFDGGAFIDYGTGNLFFDQMDDISTRQMRMDKLIIYAGKHLSTRLFTGLNEDYSRPRPMTPAERSDFLGTVFGASGW